ncbi:MAG: hypothetical protein PHF67_01565 [Candidatus Nanoarchaeia archaeon]|nr:hypothetical protein [Candidatus Nanoarchaeia archaeon]
MVEKDSILKEKLKQSGIFNFKELYEFAFNWFMDENYDLNEKKYSEKVAGDTKELEIEWEGHKKISDYFKFVLKANWKITGLKKVKVKKGDKEVTMDSGVIEIRFECVLHKDYESRWENTATLKFLRGVYDRYIIRNRIDQYEGKLIGEFTDLINQFKAFLAIEGK